MQLQHLENKYKKPNLSHPHHTLPSHHPITHLNISLQHHKHLPPHHQPSTSSPHHTITPLHHHPSPYHPPLAQPIPLPYHLITTTHHHHTSQPSHPYVPKPPYLNHLSLFHITPNTHIQHPTIHHIYKPITSKAETTRLQ
jgi:hypothetical protein